jgi:hypothetical protein
MENQNCENNCNYFEPLKNSKNLSCGHTICSKCQVCTQCIKVDTSLPTDQPQNKMHGGSLE